MTSRKQQMRPLFKPLPWWGWLVAVLLGGLIHYSAMEMKANRMTSGLELSLEKNYGLFTISDMEKKVERYLGRPINKLKVKDLNLSGLETYLDKNPFVEDADAFINADDILFVLIKMRQPVVRLMDFNGNSQFMDSEGVLMPVNEQYTIRVPVATGMHLVLNESEDEAEKWMKQLHELAEAIQQDSFMWNLTEQIHLNEDKDFVIIPKLGRERIIVGDATRLDEKFEKLKLFYREGIRRTGFGKYRSINLKFSDQVIGKLKNT